MEVKYVQQAGRRVKKVLKTCISCNKKKWIIHNTSTVISKKCQPCKTQEVKNCQSKIRQQDVIVDNDNDAELINKFLETNEPSVRIEDNEKFPHVTPSGKLGNGIIQDGKFI